MALRRCFAAALAFGSLACGLPVEGLAPGGGASAVSGAASTSTGPGGAGGAGATVAASSSSDTTTSTTAAGPTTGAGGASPACAPGFQCVPEAPAGQYVRVAAGAVQACPGGWTAPVVYGDGTDPGCTACACDPPAGGSCSPGGVNGSTQSDCLPLLNRLNFPAGICHNFTANVSALVLEASTPSAIACTPGASNPEPVPLETLCTPAAAPQTCGAGLVCVPDGDAAFVELCNLLPAGSACAPGWGSPQPVAALVDDDRMCACSCGMPVGQTCTGETLYYWSNNGCTDDPLGDQPGDDVCHQTVAPTNGSMMIDAGQWVGGTCAASQSGTGQVTFAPSETLCCLGG